MEASGHRLWIGLAVFVFAFVSLVACASQPSTRAAEGDGSWELAGSRIIACCCHSPCPCRINYKPTHRHGCDFTTAVHIDRGQINGVSMDGMMWIVTGGVFGEDAKRNWNRIYISDKATDEQHAALMRFFEAGTVDMGKAEHLAGKSLGIRRAPMQWKVSEDRRTWSAVIPGTLEVTTRAIILPGHKKPVVSSGIFDDFGDSFVHADCITHHYDDAEIAQSWDLAGQQANQANFVLNPSRVGKGGIGWACWSAHAALGDTSRSKYQETAGHR